MEVEDECDALADETTARESMLVNGGVEDDRQVAVEHEDSAASDSKQGEVVGDQPSVFGLTNKLKEAMLLDDDQEQRDIGGGQGDNYVKIYKTSGGLVNGTTTTTFAERKKGKGFKGLSAGEKKEKHRLMKSNGLFGAEGKY